MTFKALQKCTARPYYFLVIDTTQIIRYVLEKNLLERIKKIIITINDKIRDDKLQYDINKEVAKISAL